MTCSFSQYTTLFPYHLKFIGVINVLFELFSLYEESIAHLNNQTRIGVFIGNPSIRYYYEEVDSVSSTNGLYTFFFAQDWVQGKSTGKVNRYELGGAGTPEDPGIRWYFEYVKESTSSPSR